MKSSLYIVKTEPVLLTSVVQAVLALIVWLGVPLTSGQTGAIPAVTTTVLALIAVAATRPFQMSALTGLVSAVVALLIAFGVHNVRPGFAFTLTAAIVAVVAVITGLHVSLVATLNASTKPKRHHCPVLIAQDTPARHKTGYGIGFGGRADRPAYARGCEQRPARAKCRS